MVFENKLNFSNTSFLNRLGGAMGPSLVSPPDFLAIMASIFSGIGNSANELIWLNSTGDLALE